jgi:hypothetical protein
MRPGNDWRLAYLCLPAPADTAVMEAEPTIAAPPKRKRRWFQFSLRTLLLGVTLVAAACGYLAPRVSNLPFAPLRICVDLRPATQFDYESGR